MSYKKLTNTGIKFIRKICEGNDNSLLQGKKNYALTYSNDPANTVYIGHPKLFGHDITTNQELGEALIGWFNKYSEEYDLDANIIAAQAYIESNYNIWTYSQTGAQGISQFISGTLFDVAIGNYGVSSHISTNFTEDEINKLTLNITDSKQQSSYVYKSYNPQAEIAKANRKQFFQNIIDNPDLCIKAQCKLMAGLGVKAAYNAASTLFGYNKGANYVRPTFTATMKMVEKDTAIFNEGLEYVRKIFRVLGDINYTKHKPKGYWFGYDIDFTFDTFKADVETSNIYINNIDRNKKLGNTIYTIGDLTTTNTGILNIPTQTEIDRLTSLAKNVLQRITDEILDGEKLTINSAFRNYQVNAKVNGVVTSQHKSGEASDVHITATNNKTLYEVYVAIINSTIPYDQIIYEVKGENILSKWIHISYKSTKNRKMKLLATLGTDGSMEYKNYVPTTT